MASSRIDRIKEALEQSRLVIEPLGEDCIQPSSVDVHVDQYFRVFRNYSQRVIDVREAQEDLTELVDVGLDNPMILHPGEFMLGSTTERVALPDDIVGRPSMARAHSVAWAWSFTQRLASSMPAGMATSPWNCRTWRICRSLSTQA